MGGDISALRARMKVVKPVKPVLNPPSVRRARVMVDAFAGLGAVRRGAGAEIESVEYR